MTKRSTQLDWKGYFGYTEDNVQKYAPTRAGVYKIGIKQKDGKLAVRYVGQANDLDRRLKEHLDLKNEENECLVERLRKYHAAFSFVSGYRYFDGKMWSIAQDSLSSIFNTLPVLKQRLSNLSKSSLKMIFSFSPWSSRSATRRLIPDSWSCSFVRLGFNFALMTDLQLRHSICRSRGPHPLCPLKAANGNILPQVLHCFQYEVLYSVVVAKNDCQNLCAATDLWEVNFSPHDLNGKSLPARLFWGRSELFL